MRRTQTVSGKYSGTDPVKIEAKLSKPSKQNFFLNEIKEDIRFERIKGDLNQYKMYCAKVDFDEIQNETDFSVKLKVDGLTDKSDFYVYVVHSNRYGEGLVTTPDTKDSDVKHQGDILEFAGQKVMRKWAWDDVIDDNLVFNLDEICILVKK